MLAPVDARYRHVGGLNLTPPFLQPRALASGEPADASFGDAAGAAHLPDLPRQTERRAGLVQASMRAHDLTLAFRNLFHRPLFAATAILLMALAAGANAAVFSVVRGVLLKPLPYAEPDRLVAFWPDRLRVERRDRATGASARTASSKSRRCRRAG